MVRAGAWDGSRPQREGVVTGLNAVVALDERVS